MTQPRTADHGHGDHHYVFTGPPGEGAIYMRPTTTCPGRGAPRADWVKLSPFVAMLIGFGAGLLVLHREPGLPGRSRANQRPLYLSC
jgi:NADH-quinone oxidoreductase subunit L